MSTPSSLQSVQTRSTPHFNAIDWRATLHRLIGTWKAPLQARSEHRIGGFFARRRSEHERFLSKATNHYELEHLERAWEHRQHDMWRVY